MDYLFCHMDKRKKLLWVQFFVVICLIRPNY